jgi:hypothetical protein
MSLLSAIAIGTVALTMSEADRKGISTMELLFGFDQEFAERVKEAFDFDEVKTSFQNDLNALHNRWSFSLFLDGAKKSEEGLPKTIFTQIASAVTGVGLGTLLLSLALRDPHHRKAGIAILGGAFSLTAGVSAPIIIFNENLRKEKEAQFRSIVQKNLGHILSEDDCKRLTTSLIWCNNKKVIFDINNDNHLRGDNLKEPTWGEYINSFSSRY